MLSFECKNISLFAIGESKEQSFQVSRTKNSLEIRDSVRLKINLSKTVLCLEIVHIFHLWHFLKRGIK